MILALGIVAVVSALITWGHPRPVSRLVRRPLIAAAGITTVALMLTCSAQATVVLLATVVATAASAATATYVNRR